VAVAIIEEETSMKAKLSSRERILRTLQHKEADRVGGFDMYWSTTLDRWHSEGFPENASTEDYFGFDIESMMPDLSPQLPYQLIEKTADYRIEKNSYGTTLKNFQHATSTPGWLDHDIKTSADFAAIAGRYDWNPTRVPAGFRATYDHAREKERFITYGSAICWDAVLPVVGAETLMVAMLDEPEWVEEMFGKARKLFIDGYDALYAMGYRFDGIWVFDDMAYRNGPFFSPACYERFFFPHDKAVCDYFHERGLPVMLHSCGNIKPLVPRLIDAGYDCIQPLESKAGMDVC
jgi:uroporphyrinogen decarboxylase